MIVYCVNDAAVMDAWEFDQGCHSPFINFMGDPYSQLTEALGMELMHPGPQSLGLINRCKRHAMYLVDGESAVLVLPASSLLESCVILQQQAWRRCVGSAKMQMGATILRATSSLRPPVHLQ